MSIYEAHTMTDPHLPFIFHSIHFYPNRPASAGNWHENIEILFFTKGSGVVINNDEYINVAAGDIVVINANCLHSIASVDEMHYYCLIVDRSFCMANYFDTNGIYFYPLIKDKEIGEIIHELASEFASKGDQPYNVQLIRADVLRIMAILCRKYSITEKDSRAESHLLSCIKQAIGYIHSESHRDISLDDIALLVGLSKFYFAREFHRVTGYTFVSYVNLIRCEKAKQLLAENQMGIGEIGRICGFSNQSYFTRTFVKNVGCLPGEYRVRKVSSAKSK